MKNAPVFAGIANPIQRPTLRPSDRQYLSARQTELDAFEKQRQEYNTALQKWQTEVYEPYNRQYDQYEAAVNAWNAGPQDADYAGPQEPVLPSRFEMAAPSLPSGFNEQEIVARQKAAAANAQLDASSREIGIDAMADPSKYNLGSNTLSTRFMAKGGPVSMTGAERMAQHARINELRREIFSGKLSPDVKEKYQRELSSYMVMSPADIAAQKKSNEDFKARAEAGLAKNGPNDPTYRAYKAFIDSQTYTPEQAKMLNDQARLRINAQNEKARFAAEQAKGERARAEQEYQAYKAGQEEKKRIEERQAARRLEELKTQSQIPMVSPVVPSFQDSVARALPYPGPRFDDSVARALPYPGPSFDDSVARALPYPGPSSQPYTPMMPSPVPGFAGVVTPPSSSARLTRGQMPLVSRATMPSAVSAPTFQFSAPASGSPVSRVPPSAPPSAVPSAPSRAVPVAPARFQSQEFLNQQARHEASAIRRLDELRRASKTQKLSGTSARRLAELESTVGAKLDAMPNYTQPPSSSAVRFMAEGGSANKASTPPKVATTSTGVKQGKPPERMTEEEYERLRNSILYNPYHDRHWTFSQKQPEVLQKSIDRLRGEAYEMLNNLGAVDPSQRSMQERIAEGKLRAVDNIMASQQRWAARAERERAEAEEVKASRLRGLEEQYAKNMAYFQQRQEELQQRQLAERDRIYKTALPQYQTESAAQLRNFEQLQNQASRLQSQQNSLFSSPDFTSPDRRQAAKQGTISQGSYGMGSNDMLRAIQAAERSPYAMPYYGGAPSASVRGGSPFPSSGQPLFTGDGIRIANPEIPMIGGYDPLTTGRRQQAVTDQSNYFAMGPRTTSSMPGTIGLGYDPTAAYQGPTASSLLLTNPNLGPTMLGGERGAGMMTDRLGNQIFAPGGPLVYRTFAEGGEVDADEPTLEDDISSAQSMMDQLEAAEVKPTKISRLRRREQERSMPKGMGMEYGSLTAAKDESPKSPKSAKAELEMLARKYKIKQRQIANASRGLGKNTFGAPTLEQPTLTSEDLMVKRFQKGGAVKKSEAAEELSVLSKLVDAVAQRLPAENLPTAGKLLIETAQGKKGDITERDFSPEQLEVIRELIVSRGTPAGSVGYGEYEKVGSKRAAAGKEKLFPLSDPVFNTKHSLGKFRYARDAEGNLVALDTYDFDPLGVTIPGAPRPTQESRTGDYGVSNVGYGLLREYAGEKIPPGKGRGVRINLGGGRPPGYAEGGEVEQDLSGPITTPLQFNKRQKRGRISEALNDPSAAVYGTMARGASELPYDLLGAPVDIATMLMRPAGYSVEKPVGGSEFIKEKMTKAGVRPEPPSDSVDKGFYTAGELLANLTNPAGVTRSAARGAGKAADMLEDVTVGNVQRAKVRGAAKKAEATPESAYDPLRQRMEEQGLLSYAVRPTGSTMISGDIAGQSGQGIVDGILAQGKSNARNAAGADDAMASALENFWEKKAKNYFTRQFGTPNDPIADALSKGRISNFETQELFPQYMVDQIGVGKTRVNPRTGEPQFFPKYPRAMEDFTSRYDEATGLTGLAYAPGMGDPGYSTILRNEAHALRREFNDAEMDRLVQQGVRPELVNTNIDVVTESGKDPGRFIAQSYIPNSFDQLLAAYKGNASMPQSLRIPLERQEPLYDSRGLKAPLENLLDPPRINEYLAGLSPREVSKIRFEDAVVGASKVENPRYRLKALQDKIKSGKPVPDSVFSKGVSAPLLQIKEGPLEGFAWKRIVDREATVPEGAYVGHSVGGYELGGVTYGPERMNGFNTGLYEIYSLRDKRNRPVNTIEVKNDPLFGKTVTQIKGNGRATGNVSPDKYDTAVLDFLTNYLRPARISESTDLLTPLLQEYKMRVNSGS